MSLLCPVETCTWGKGGARYSTNSHQARAAHVAKRHPEEMKPLPNPPTYTPVLAPRRAAVYLRVSTIDQHPENQLPACRMFCGVRGYEVVGHYVDKASGKNMQRPELQRLLSDSVQVPPPFDVVVFRRMSRLGRSLRDNIALFDHFQSLGIAMVSVEEPYDTTSASGRLIRNVLASVHEYERENLVEMTREGIERRRAEGKYLGRHPMGCGIPTELGGLGPCPDGIQHKGLNQDLLSLGAKRAKNRQRVREYRARKKGVTRVVAQGTPLSGVTPPAEQGA